MVSRYINEAVLFQVLFTYIFRRNNSIFASFILIIQLYLPDDLHKKRRGDYIISRRSIKLGVMNVVRNVWIQADLTKYVHRTHSAICIQLLFQGVLFFENHDNWNTTNKGRSTVCNCEITYYNSLNTCNSTLSYYV
jgi:hypothetical protein